MLVIAAEISPAGDKTRGYVVGEMRIANENNTRGVSSYSVTPCRAVDPTSGAAGWQSRLVIQGHRRAGRMWALVRTILHQAILKWADAKPSSGEGKIDA